MKNASRYADALRGLVRQLTRQHQPEPKQPMEPLKALVRAAMTWDVADSKAAEAMRAIEREFVDLNELRVATDLEIQELLGVRYPEIGRRVTMITQALNNIFEREHTLSLERLKGVSRRDARQFLRELPGVHPFVEAYVMLFSFDGACFPIDDETLQFLKEEEVVDVQATLEEAQRFIEYQLEAEQIYAFFTAVRAAVFEESRRRKKAKA